MLEAGPDAPTWWSATSAPASWSGWASATTTLREVNPSIIWASGTGFGESGPYAHKGGQDVIAQAYSGVMWRRIGRQIAAVGLPDHAVRLHHRHAPVQGILLALMARDPPVRARRSQVNMYDSMLHMQMQEAAMQLNRGYEINWAAMPLSGVFETTDGAVCMVGAFKENPLRRHLAWRWSSTRTCPLRGRVRDAEEQFGHKPGAAGHLPGAVRHQHHRALGRPGWRSRTSCAPPVRTLAEALDDEQTLVNKMIVEMEHPTPARFVR